MIVYTENTGKKYRKKSIIIAHLRCDNCGIEFTEKLSQCKDSKRHYHSRECQGTARQRGGIAHNEIYEKVRSTFMDHYGTSSLGASLEIRRKIEATNLQKYGAKNVLGSKQIREKRKQTMIERYGAENSMNCEQIKAKYDFRTMAVRRHQKMKENGTYAHSRIEDRFYEALCRQFSEADIERPKIVNRKWPIDFYIRSVDVYVQFDGVYWHGLDRPLDVIKEFKTPRDRVIYQKFITDCEQKSWFAEQNLKLVRVTDREFKAAGLSWQLLVP